MVMGSPHFPPSTHDNGYCCWLGMLMTMLLLVSIGVVGYWPRGQLEEMREYRSTHLIVKYPTR